MNNQCKKVEKCPLFNNKLLKRQQSAETYKALYCNAGEEKYTLCKRYIVSESLGKCPDFVLPNSSYSIEEIKDKIRSEGILS